MLRAWLVKAGSIAAVVKLMSPGQSEFDYTGVYMSETRPVEWSKSNGSPVEKGWVPPEEVVELVNRHFKLMFSKPVEERQAFIDRCKKSGPAMALPGQSWTMQSCCLAEERLNGGCIVCGDPAL